MPRFSKLAESLIPSEIIRQGNEINERIKAGASIFNYTIGDFNPSFFPIPQALENSIIDAYQEHRTNYPPAPGLAELRDSVSVFLKEREQLGYAPDEILIASGGRPLIYAAYMAIVDKGDKVVYTVPSWNNNHYTHFVQGEHVVVETSAEQHFMPTAEQLEPLLVDATLLALCSPLNPTGTMISAATLAAICNKIVAINRQRAAHEKPLYLLYDQMYWMLTFGDNQHVHPVVLNEDMRPYTITVDGMSKAFCATGVRVGWGCGPKDLIMKMTGMLSHIGAWSPMAEQYASAQFLKNTAAVNAHVAFMQHALSLRLQNIYEGLESMRRQGLPVKAIAPQGAMYLALAFEITGLQTPAGTIIHNTDDITNYLLHAANIAVVPFKAFGAVDSKVWYRLSVGVCDDKTIPRFLENLKAALMALN